MNAIIFSIGTFQVFAFGFFLALSFLLSTFVLWKLTKDDLLSDTLVDVYILTCLGALIASRVIYIISHFSEFGGHLLSYIVFRQAPGLSLVGAIAGGTGVLLFLCKKNKLPLIKVADVFSVTASFALSIALIGEFLGGGSFGKPVGTTIGVVVKAVEGYKHAVEIYQAVAFLILFIILLVVRNKQFARKHEGAVSFLFLLGLSLFVLILEFFKASSLYLYHSISLTILASGITCGITSVFLVKWWFFDYRLKKGKK